MWKKTILSVTVVLGMGMAVLGYYYWPSNKGTEALRLPGTVESYEVRLCPRISGRVAQVAVAEGDTVEAGQALVYLEKPGLEAQRDQCRARLAAAEAELYRAENGPRSEEKAAASAAVAGAKAKLARLRAGPRKEELDQARSELEASNADLRRAKNDLEREERLSITDSSSRSQLDAAQAAYARILGQVKVNRARLQQLEAGTRPEEIQEAEAEVDRAQAQDDLLRAGTRSEDIQQAQERVRELQARLAEIDNDIREATVCAPERAVVEVLAVRPGDVVAANQSVARVLRTNDLWVKAFIPETQLGKVRLNQEVSVTVDAYPTRRFVGRVVQIAAASEFTPRNVQSADERRHQVFAIKIQMVDPDGVFKAGMAAEVFLPLDGR